MTKKEIIKWVNGEFDKFDERVIGSSRELQRVYGGHYRHVALEAIKELTK